MTTKLSEEWLRERIDALKSEPPTAANLLVIKAYQEYLERKYGH